MHLRGPHAKRFSGPLPTLLFAFCRGEFGAGMPRFMLILLASGTLAMAASRNLPAQTAQMAAKGSIPAHGIDGSLVLCGSGEVSKEALDEFAKLAGGKKANIVVLRGPDASKEGQAVTQRLLDSWETKGLASFAVVRLPLSDADGGQHLKLATGVWLADGGASVMKAGTAVACQAVLNRGGVVAAAGRAAESLSTLMLPTTKDGAQASGLNILPDSILLARTANERAQTPFSAALKQHSALVGYDVSPGAVMVVSGRIVRPLGTGQIMVHFAGTQTRPEKAAAITKKNGDLTTFRRTAVERSANFPPAKPGEPVVEKGTLVIVGGGTVGDEIISKFVELAGGKGASIVILPAAKGDPLSAKDNMPDRFRKYGAKSVTIVVGRKMEEVEKPEYIDALSGATGVWFHGGRQGKINDAYEGTKVQALLYEVLKRGGVIGGSSAGASIQTEFLVRGSPGSDQNNMFEGYQRGFNFLPGVAIDQHFSKRGRFGVMTKLMQTYPQFLGIGIDESTAIVVKGHTADVIGKGSIYVYDTRKAVEKGKQDYETIKTGGRMDLKSRQALPTPDKSADKEPLPAILPMHHSRLFLVPERERSWLAA